MGSPVGEPRLATRSSAGVWYACLAATLLLCCTYVALSLSDSYAALIAAQFLYVLPPVSAVVLCLMARARAQAVDHLWETRTWSVLALTMAFLAAGETAIAIYQVAVQPDGPSNFWISDVAFVGAAFSTFWLLMTLGGIDRLPGATRLRLVADFVVLLSLGAALGFAGWSQTMLAGTTMPTDVAITASFYGVQAVVALGVASMLWMARRGQPGPPWMRVLAGGFLVFAVGLFLWPAWRVGEYGTGSRVTELGTESLYLAGYALVASAALLRVLDTSDWDPTPSLHPHQGRDGWPSVVVSSLVLAAMAVIVALVIVAPAGSNEERVFFAALVVGGIGVLISTTAASFEGRSEGNRSLTDPVTGLGNARWFEDALVQELSEASRAGEQFGLLSIDIDDFARVNDSIGYVRADAVLTDIAEAINLAAGPEAVVCRTTGDEFTAIVPRADADAAADVARSIVASVRRIKVASKPMSASVGVASWPGDATEPDELRHAAEAAEAWAKCHGKNRVVAAGSGVTRRIDEDERIRIAKTGLRLDSARGLAAAVDARDIGNPYHGTNVAALATLVAERIGFDQDHVSLIEAAALLHDVGTLALPDYVLESPGRAAAIRKREHAELGESFCRSIGFEDVAPWVRSHHEHWDGTGYPDGLEGTAIPFESRLLALCDSYDLLTGGHPGRGGLSRGAALQEIDLGIASRFDPKLAEQFIAIVGSYDALGWDETGEAS